MDWLPQKLSQYFDSVYYGSSLLLPEIRQANRPFLLIVYEALQLEEYFTSVDINHLETLMHLSDLIKIAAWHDIKSLIATEIYLTKRLPFFPKKAIRYCMEYLYYLLSRHGRIKPEMKIPTWFLIWRRVQHFPEFEQLSVSNFIGWMRKNQFSPASILDRVRKLQTFKSWMIAQEINRMDQMTKEKACQYLHERSQNCQVNTSQKISVQIQTFFDYYRAQVDGLFPALCLSRFRSGSEPGMDANSGEIAILWNALKGGAFPAEAALILIFVLGLGLPLKVLPLLRLAEQPGRLLFFFQHPNRQGIHEHAIVLSLDEPWIMAYWTEYLKAHVAPAKFTYLFTSTSAIKKRQPVSSEYCRRKLQSHVAKILGYTITVNRLERGSLKAMALRFGYDVFMERVQNVTLSNRTKLFIWLNGQDKRKAQTKPCYRVNSLKAKAKRVQNPK